MSFLRGAQIFETMSNTFFQGGEKNFRGLRPTWLRAWGKVVTARPPTRLPQVRSSLLCLQRQVARKCAVRSFAFKGRLRN